MTLGENTLEHSKAGSTVDMKCTAQRQVTTKLGSDLRRTDTTSYRLQTCVAKCTLPCVNIATFGNIGNDTAQPNSSCPCGSNEIISHLRPLKTHKECLICCLNLNKLHCIV